MAAAAEGLSTHNTEGDPISVIFSEVPQEQRDVIQPFSMFVTRREVLDLLHSHIDKVDDRAATVLYYRIRADLESSLESIVSEEPYYTTPESYRATLQRIFHEMHPGKFVFLELRDQNASGHQLIQVHEPEQRNPLDPAQKIQNIISHWEQETTMEESEKIDLREQARYLLLALETGEMEASILEQGKSALLSMINEVSGNSNITFHRNFGEALNHLLESITPIEDNQSKASVSPIPQRVSKNIESFRSTSDLIQFFKLWKSRVDSDQTEKYLDLIQDFISLIDAGSDLTQKSRLVSNLKNAIETMSNNLMDQGITTPDNLSDGVDDLAFINVPKVQVRIFPPESWNDSCSLLDILELSVEDGAEFSKYKKQVLKIQENVTSGVQPTNHQIDIALLGFVRIINMFKDSDEVLMQDRAKIVHGFKVSIDTLIKDNRFCLTQEPQGGSTRIEAVPLRAATPAPHLSNRSGIVHRLGKGLKKLKFW